MRPLLETWILPCLISVPFVVPVLMVGCAALGNKLGSPTSGGDQTVGYRSDTKLTTSASAEDSSHAGGIVGRVGGNGDSVALWLAVAALGTVAIGAYPIQRKARLLWNSWRSPRGVSRQGKGREACIKISEWEGS